MPKQQSALPSDVFPELKPQHFLRNEEDTPYLSSVCAPRLTEFLTRTPSSATCPSVLRLQAPVPGAELWSGQQSLPVSQALPQVPKPPGDPVYTDLLGRPLHQFTKNSTPTLVVSLSGYLATR